VGQADLEQSFFISPLQSGKNLQARFGSCGSIDQSGAKEQINTDPASARLVAYYSIKTIRIPVKPSIPCPAADPF